MPSVAEPAVKEDALIRDNPCRIKGYDRYHTPERPVATIEQVYRPADHLPARFRALVILAALSGLRWGELAALRRADVDLVEGIVRVPRKLAALRHRMEFGPPKSEAGRRVVALPAAAVSKISGSEVSLRSGWTAVPADALIPSPSFPCLWTAAPRAVFGMWLVLAVSAKSPWHADPVSVAAGDQCPGELGGPHGVDVLNRRALRLDV